jgi:hypothetical protein
LKTDMVVDLDSRDEKLIRHHRDHPSDWRLG